MSTRGDDGMATIRRRLAMLFLSVPLLMLGWFGLAGASQIGTSAISKQGGRGMRTLLTRLAVLLLLAPGLLLLTVAGVEAQDKWSFVFTPQVWFENVRNSGFAATTNAGGAAFTLSYVPPPANATP